MALMFSPGGESGREGGENRASGGRFSEAKEHPGGRLSGGASMIVSKKCQGGGLRERWAGLGMPSRQRTPAARSAKIGGRAFHRSFEVEGTTITGGPR